ncbi:amidohydrolase family protein [Flavivirga jejuensis]|uniref:Amidohydrolase family protein n=1 Tax=Flavivirga jejuensis TaxID=870487 RepID=A0ABT8WT44_9FLAO|nr:amidohydrolase family protein [Flavivirga jejuensis]MDO5976358.1 amidohydrolase family protein [Flavivirga jejuensis]
MIIDCHSHLASHKVLPASFLKGIADNVVSSVPQKLLKSQKEHLKGIISSYMHGDDDGTLLINEMDNAEISKSILLIIDYGIMFPKEFPSIKEIHKIHRKLLLKYPDRFIIFSGIDPRRGQEGLYLFEKAIKDWGFKGLKLYPPCGFSPSDPILFSFYEIAEQYEVPVLLHTGPTSPTMSFKYSAPELIDDAAYRFPKVNFILAHAGFMMHQQAAILAEYRSNIYLDLSGFTNAIRMENFKNILMEHKKRGILNKLIFGTDWPIHRLNGNQKSLVNTFKTNIESILSSEEINNIMCNNISRILK